MKITLIRQRITQLLLFLITLTATTLAGAEWQFGRFVGVGEGALTWDYFWQGLWFSVPFLGILTVHEFGHYFTARYHRVRVTLPFYIPMWLGFGALFGFPMPSIGTMGAFIRIKEAIKTRQQYFDIGISGPLAGFVVALGVLFYGFTHLPPPEHIYTIHPEYEQYGADYAQHVYDEPGALQLGTTLLFDIFKTYVADAARMPNAYEIIHYPWLFAGFLSLFFTALNLIPIGQLDGGHILYGLVGYRSHRRISAVLFVAFITYAGLGLVTPAVATEDLLTWGIAYLGFLYLTFSRLTKVASTNFVVALGVFTFQFVLVWLVPAARGYQGWLVFGFLIGRVLGVYHPPAAIDRPLGAGRKLLGWIALVVFILCFSPSPFVVE